MLKEFVTANRDEIITRCRANVATRVDRPPIKGEIDHGVPMFLDQLVAELSDGQSQTREITRTATLHGKTLQRLGFNASQVVHDYGDVCQSITGLAVELAEPISSGEFRTLNRCLDDAIAGAVTEYGRERDESSEGEPSVESPRLGKLARDLMTSLSISRAALDVIRSGTVGIKGTTAEVLSLGLDTACDLTERLLLVTVAPNAAQPVSSPTLDD